MQFYYNRFNDFNGQKKFKFFDSRQNHKLNFVEKIFAVRPNVSKFIILKFSENVGKIIKAPFEIESQRVHEEQA